VSHHERAFDEFLRQFLTHIIIKNPLMEWLMATLGAICLLAPLKEHSGRQNILLADSNKQTVNPESGHQPWNSKIYTLRIEF